MKIQTTELLRSPQRILYLCVCAALTAGLLVSCKKNNDETDGNGGSIQGCWYADMSGNTYAKWTYGDTWQKTVFNADGTGNSAIYYLIGSEAVACETDTFTYTTDNGKLTTTSAKGGRTVTAGYTADKSALQLSDDKRLLSYAKLTDAMQAKFDAWSKTEGMIDVPQPAKHTVLVYGNAGGTMDDVIEYGFWEKAPTFLTDPTNVRVACVYKYGKDQPEINRPFAGKYCNPGDVVWFELNSRTDLNRIKDEGMQAVGMGDVAQRMKICDPNMLRAFLAFTSLYCPAENYTFAIWGHGSGFDPKTDLPGKYDVYPTPRRAPQGVIADEWNEGEQLNMYELHDAIHTAGFDRLNTIFFHNCLMGNLETLMEVRDCAEYICASSHLLSSEGEVLTEFVRGLAEKGNTEDAVAQMFERITPTWQNGYNDDPGEPMNGDYKLIRTDRFMPVVDVIKRLADHLIALYTTQREAIDRATRQVYRFRQVQEYRHPFYDIADYAHLLATETGDAEFATIAADLDRTISDAILQYRDVNWKEQHLDHYTLSVCLLSASYYTYDYKSDVTMKADANFDEGYELSSFHTHTGWGNWLRMNQQSMVEH